MLPWLLVVVTDVKAYTAHVPSFADTWGWVMVVYIFFQIETETGLLFVLTISISVVLMVDIYNHLQGIGSSVHPYRPTNQREDDWEGGGGADVPDRGVPHLLLHSQQERLPVVSS